MKMIHSIQKNNLAIYFSFLFICSCAVPIPIPEQNFNQNLEGVEYEAFDLAAESIFIFQKEKKQQNEALLLSLRKNEIENEENKKWYQLAKTADEIGSNLISEIESVWDQIIYQSGGRDAKGHPLGADQKIVANEILFEKVKAYELQTKIKETKEKWLELIPNQDYNRINKELPDFFKNKNWVTEKTIDLQIGVLQLTFAHLIFGIEDAKEELLTYFWEKINSPPLVFDQYQIVSNPRKSFVLKGEKYETDISLAPILNPFGDENMVAFVNGYKIPFRDGVAKYKTTAGSSLGERKYTVQIKVKDPLTGEENFYEKPFEYEVGVGAVQILPTRMNVLYIGVSNPVSISVAGVPSSQIKVELSGGGGASIRKTGGGNYTINATRPTKLGNEVQLEVDANGITSTYLFRVKRIPDPVAKVGGKQGGAIGVGEFQAQGGVLASLDNFDFDAKCKIQGFLMTRITKNGDRINTINRGPRYSEESRGLIEQATRGDIYIYEKVRARCPGDPAGRAINSMVFRIK